VKREEVVFLTSRDVGSLLTLEDCIPAVEAAFRLYGEGKTVPPGVLSLHADDGAFHIKAGALSLDRHYFAAKVNANFPQNPSRHHLPTIQGMVVLCDACNGIPLAIMDSGELTALRTAAATAVAAKYLALRDADTVTIIGCGVQGRAQLAALVLVRRLKTVFAYDVVESQRERFAREMSAELGISIKPVVDLRSAVRESEICITCTTSQKPVLSKQDVSPGTFIAAVGADNPQKQELDPELMGAATIVVDVLDQCAVMGDLHHALAAGMLTREDVYAELGEIVAGRKPGRTSQDQITIFDSTGMALQDVAATALVYQKAQECGAGAWFNLAA
jgi:alanine dehydrogenase